MKNIRKITMAALVAFSVVIACGCTKSDDPNNGGGGNNGGGNGGGTYNGHEYVDLGLPSGTLWATCNVGATSPEEYGDYFAWGETSPKTTYNWSTYLYCNGNSRQLTKYCEDSSYGYNGFTDNLTSLQPIDDAATSNWGDGWCMPTIGQWLELFRVTTQFWTIQNGVIGELITAANGNTLFLPAAGYCWTDELGDAGILCYYWSSSLSTAFSTIARSVCFRSGICDPEGKYRACGLPVRAVRSASQN